MAVKVHGSSASSAPLCRRRAAVQQDTHANLPIATASTDAELLRLCASGETVALGELVRRHHRALHRFAYGIVGNEQDAEDVAAETFLRVWHGAARFRGNCAARTWVYTIAANLARDLCARRTTRERGHRVLCAEAVAHSSYTAEQEVVHREGCAEAASTLLQALDTLAVADRTLLTLYYLDDWTYPEIQAVVGVPYPVLKTRLARARARLRVAMYDVVAAA